MIEAWELDSDKFIDYLKENVLAVYPLPILHSVCVRLWKTDIMTNMEWLVSIATKTIIKPLEN